MMASAVADFPRALARPPSMPLRAAAERAPRIVLYSHDTLGFGHLRRNLLLAGALKASAAAPEVLMIAGMREAGAFELPPGVDCLTLPAYAKGADGKYRPRDLGADLDPLVALRSQAILATVASYAPHLMIVDNVPRGAMAELDPVLKALHRSGQTRLVLGLRDVIDAAPAVRRQWLRQRNFEAVRKFYSEVWVYGDPSFYDPVAEYALGEEILGKTRYIGYLDQRVRLDSPAAGPTRDAVLGDDPRPYVICAVGGGRDGAALCGAFVKAAMPPGHRGVLITGLQMPPADPDRLKRRAAARSDLTVVDFVNEPIALMAGAARIVAMGGYNTVCEVLSLGRPALIVPRTRPRAEQILRAERLAAKGMIDMLPPDRLNPEVLEQWLASARRGSRRPAKCSISAGSIGCRRSRR